MYRPPAHPNQRSPHLGASPGSPPLDLPPALAPWLAHLRATDEATARFENESALGDNADALSALLQTTITVATRWAEVDVRLDQPKTLRALALEWGHEGLAIQVTRARSGLPRYLLAADSEAKYQAVPSTWLRTAMTTFDRKPVDLQAHLHHAYLLGLLLMISSRREGKDVKQWMFNLFRRQHHDKFLSSFGKLGLEGLPDAVACAKYHVLANGIGGVPVEYMAESDTKAWVRFRYPRWWLDGPTLCGVPPEAGHGFLLGWYAHNGVSLGNPRLGFVCVSQDMTGEFGFCGYFQEYDHDLEEGERLRFAEGEPLPPYDANAQPIPPAEHWSEERLVKANRNYAVEFVRNALIGLLPVIGEEATGELGGLAARLIGLQYFEKSRQGLGAEDADAAGAAQFLRQAFSGMGDTCTVEVHAAGREARVHQASLRIVRDLEGTEREIVLSCWIELWRGMLRAHRHMKSLDVTANGDGLEWTIRD